MGLDSRVCRLSCVILPREILCVVQVCEECRLADQPFVLAGLFTGSADLCFHNLERVQRGPTA